MNQNEAELSAETGPSVVAGLGYPNGRDETSPTSTGWFGFGGEETVNVSRETLPEKP